MIDYSWIASLSMQHCPATLCSFSLRHILQVKVIVTGVPIIYFGIERVVYFISFSNFYLFLFFKSLLVSPICYIWHYLQVISSCDITKSKSLLIQNFPQYTNSPIKQIKTLKKRIQQTYIWSKEININRMLTQQQLPTQWIKQVFRLKN